MSLAKVAACLWHPLYWLTCSIILLPGISKLGSIIQCLNLCILDLSSNHLSSVGELSALVTLEHLDLSDNSISQLRECQAARIVAFM
jgi:hypothetical protein